MNGTPTFEDFLQTYLPNNQAGQTNQLHPAQMGGANMMPQFAMPPHGIGANQGMPPQQGMPGQIHSFPPMQGGQQGWPNMHPQQAPGGQPPNQADQMAQWIAMLQAMHGGQGAPTQPPGISAHTGMGQAPGMGMPGQIHSFPPMQPGMGGQQVGPQSLSNLIQSTGYAPVKQPGAEFGGPMGTPALA
jgi:hypothetical protein